MERRRLSLLAALAFIAIALACTSSKTPATPVAPTTSSAASAADGSTLKVTAPTPVSPANETKLTDQNPTLTIAGASSTQGAAFESPLQYDFEVYDFNGVKVETQVVASTTYRVAMSLDFGKRYTWRARAAYPPPVGAYGPW